MILCSTSRGIYNLTSKEYTHENEGVCFGLAKTEEANKTLFAAFRIGNYSGLSHDTRICSFDESLNLKNKFDIKGCEDVHGIEIFEDSIYILSTKTNRIYQTNFQGEVLQVHEGIPSCERSHMNTIKRHNDRLLIICHRDSFDAQSCLYEFNPHTQEMLCLSRFLGDHSHSILYFQDRFWICDSLNGRVFSVSKEHHVKNPDTSPQLETLNHIETEAIHLLRGLATDEDFLYVGASAKASTAERHKGCDGGVVKMNKQTGEVLEEIVIPECGQVNEILCY